MFGLPTRLLPSGLSKVFFLHCILSFFRTICPAHLSLVILTVVTKSLDYPNSASNFTELVCPFLALSLQWVRASTCTRFLDHTERRTTVSRTSLDEWLARRRDLYLITQNTHNRQTSMPLVVFEPTISAGERPKTYVLDRAATGTCLLRSRHQCFKRYTEFIFRIQMNM
jgi:hypothetical protein